MTTRDPAFKAILADLEAGRFKDSKVSIAPPLSMAQLYEHVKDKHGVSLYILVHSLLTGLTKLNVKVLRYKEWFNPDVIDEVVDLDLDIITQDDKCITIKASLFIPSPGREGDTFSRLFKDRTSRDSYANNAAFILETYSEEVTSKFFKMHQIITKHFFKDLGLDDIGDEK